MSTKNDKYMGLWVIDLVFKMTKSMENMISPTLIRTFSTTLVGVLVEQSTNWRIVLMGFNSPNPNLSHTEYESELTLASRSNNALWMV